MGLGSFLRGVGGLAIGVGIGVATGNPAAGIAAFNIASGIGRATGGRSLIRYGEEYEEAQIALAEEYAEQQLLIGQQQLTAAQHAAGMLAHQAGMLRRAAARARELAEANALLVLEEGEEVLRRTKKEHKQLEQDTRARLWATGFLADKGSMKKFQVDLRKENRQQQQWISRSYEQQATIVREGGDIEAAVLRAQAVGVEAGAAQIAAEGAAAFAMAQLNAQQAIAAAQFAGDPYIQEGRSQFIGGIGDLALGIGTAAVLGGFGRGASTSTGAGGRTLGYRPGRIAGPMGGGRFLPSPSGHRGAI